MKKSFIYIFLIIILLFTFSCKSFASEILENTTYSESYTLSINDLNIYSDCIVMIEKDTCDILYEKNIYEKMYPASTTKILTAILVLENCDLNEIATVSSTSLKVVPPTYAIANLQPGEELRVEDLLYAMLIPSANDAANVLAEHVGGSISDFAKLMNEKASELGCKNSNFTNSSGIHDENLYTTAYDLSIIARYAMNFETFRKIVTTTTYTLPSTAVYTKSDRIFTISNSLLNPSFKDYYYEYTTGIKTGYTNPAKDCLVASAKKDGIEFIIVVLGADYTQDGLREKYLDCKTLFDFAFANYTSHYQELQQEKQKESNLSLFTSTETTEITDENTNYDFLKILSKIVAIITIVLALKLLFFRKKKKNRYKLRYKKKARH